MVGGSELVKEEQVIVKNEYDKLGRLKKKDLGSNDLETLTYDYNVRGWLLGMNRDYAKDENNTNYFGFDLGYDKTNNGLIGDKSYTLAQYNGNIAGTVWKSKGDGEKRKYDFGYDNVNRLLKADFTQYTASNFTQAAGVNYNVKMGDGADPATAYDANGNIKRMQQWGLKLSNSSQVDDLTYDYITNSNKLKAVTEAMLGTTDNKLGDFTDKNTANDDYSYDPNGNLNLDKNKSISAITYNHLNLPETITVTGKGTITYTYDAAGNKLKKQVAETGQPTKTTLYLGGIYENDQLQFIGHEEGRIRFKPAIGATPAGFEFDYFIKDHLGNVRMVLTEEEKQDIYPAATLENSTYNGGTAISTEDDFYSINPGNIVLQSVATGIPAYQNNNGNPPYNNNPFSNHTANSARLYLLNATNNTQSNKTGLGILLKVMSGDKVNVFGNSYHKKPGAGYSNATNPLTVTDIINLFTAIPAITDKGISTGQITGATGFPVNINSLLSNPPAQSSSRPRAGINWIILDEQFKFVTGGFDVVGDAGSSTSGTFKAHSLIGLEVEKNGYFYAWCSNESQYNVFFDNLQLIHDRGAILEETHYYPFGLVMQGISSKAAGGKENKFKFGGKELQSNEFTDGAGLEMYDFGARNYDAQIGRWHTVDPLADQMRRYSTYNYAFNNPLRYIDPDGMAPLDWVQTADGQMKWDDRVKDDASAKKYYGDGSKYREKGFTYNSPEGTITLGDNRQFSVDGITNTAVNSTGQDGGTTLMQTGDATNELSGSTSTNKVTDERDIINTGILGDKLSIYTYTGTVIGKEGDLITTDVSTNNGMPEGGSLTIGGILTLGYSTDLSLSVGVGAFGYEGHVSVGLGIGLGQVGIGGSYTANGFINGGGLTARAGLGTLAVVITRGAIIPILERLMPVLK